MSARTSLPHASDAFHVAALRERGADIGSHRTRRDSIATDSFGAVERTGVLRQANETVFARSVCSTCGRQNISTDVFSVGNRLP
jgi:hypothetical protein